MESKLNQNYAGNKTTNSLSHLPSIHILLQISLQASVLQLNLHGFQKRFGFRLKPHLK